MSLYLHTITYKSKCPQVNQNTCLDHHTNKCIRECTHLVESTCLLTVTDSRNRRPPLTMQTFFALNVDFYTPLSLLVPNHHSATCTLVNITPSAYHDIISFLNSFFVYWTHMYTRPVNTFSRIMSQHLRTLTQIQTIYQMIIIDSTSRSATRKYTSICALNVYLLSLYRVLRAWYQEFAR